MVSGSLGLIFGNVLGALASAPYTITSKSRTPKERALVYIAAANNHWFHTRGLHALLVDTRTELATTVDTLPETLLETAHIQGFDEAADQMASLMNPWIDDVTVQAVEEAPETPLKATLTSLSQSSTSFLLGKAPAKQQSSHRRHSCNLA